MFKQIRRAWAMFWFQFGWRCFVNDYSSWCDTVFPVNRSTESILIHLEREVKELREAINEPLPMWSEINREFGDCIMLLADLQYIRGLNGGNGTIEKYAVNRNRTWKLDTEGCSIHVKEDSSRTPVHDAYAEPFKKAFGEDLALFWDEQGFNLQEFDEKFLKSGDRSVKEAVELKFGYNAARLIERLVNC